MISINSINYIIFLKSVVFRTFLELIITLYFKTSENTSFICMLLVIFIHKNPK